MADTSTNPPRAVKSMEELAAIMAENREKMREGKPNQGTDTSQQGGVGQNEDIDDDQNDTDGLDDGEEEQDVSQEQESDGGDTDDEAADTGDVEDGDEDEQASSDADEEDREEAEELVLSDDDLLEIDGIDEPITLKQLKDVYKSDDAIVAKVAEADATLNRVSNTFATVQNEATKLQEAMKYVIEQVDQVIAVPVISKPDDALKASNPAQYIQHLEAYQQDQQRIADTRKAVLDTLNNFDEQRKEVKNQQRAHELGLLADKLPGLKDEATKAKHLRDIVDASAHYGFTPEELQEAADHRILQMAYDAQQYRKISAGSSKETQEEREKNLKRVIRSQPTKRMRSGGTQAPEQRKSIQRRVKVAASKAKSTGKPEDVAAFMSQRRQLT